MRVGCNRRPSTPRSEREVGSASPARVASRRRRAGSPGRAWRRGRARVAASWSAVRCWTSATVPANESHDQQDREADRERPQPAVAAGYAAGPRLPHRAPRRPRRETRARADLPHWDGLRTRSSAASRRVPRYSSAGSRPETSQLNSRRPRTRWWSRRPSRSFFQPASQAGPLPQQRLVRDLGRAVARGDETPCDERLEHVRVSELDEGHPPADAVGVFCGLGESEQELAGHSRCSSSVNCRYVSSAKSRPPRRAHHRRRGSRRG